MNLTCLVKKESKTGGYRYTHDGYGDIIGKGATNEVRTCAVPFFSSKLPITD